MNERSLAQSRSLAGRVTEAEWRTRVELAAAYRLVALYRWDDLVYTHITARLPDSDHHFLINPYGMMFEEITASSLVKIDLNGNKIDDSPWPVNPAGFTIHSAIHAAREDAGCVLHTHTINGVAVSAQKGGLLPLSQHSIFPLASLGYHDYEGVALRDDEKPRLVADLGDRMALMLRNHGLLTVGRTVADAFQTMYFLETACAIQLRAQAGGARLHDALIAIDPRIIATAQQQARAATNAQGSALMWTALLRKLDRIDAGFRD